MPANIDYYYPKHLMELAIFDEVRRLEEAGYDAVVVGCCYDPGVRVARELVDIPVVGPLEAAMNHASYFGHSFTVVTDHAKARPWLEDLVRIHGAGNCRGVRFIDWYVTDMIEDTTAVADDAAAACLTALKEDQAEVIILGCTIIGGCLEREIMTTGRHGDLPILNPNLLALRRPRRWPTCTSKGKYNISRVGLYQRHEQHDPAEAEEVRRRWHLDRSRGAVRDPAVTVPTSATVAEIAGAGRRATTSRSRRANGSRSSSTTAPTPRSRPSCRARRWTPAATRSSMTIPPRARSGAEPPAPAAAAMAAADVVLCAASTSLYHTTAKAAAQRAGARGVFNAPYRADAWRNGAMTADFLAIRRRAEALAALWRTTDEVRVTSPAGTDLRATVTGRAPMAWLTGICRNAGRGVGAARRRGVAAADRGHDPGDRRLGAGRVGPRRARRARPDHDPRRSRAGDRRRVVRAPAARDRGSSRDADNIGEIGIGLNPAARIGDEITEAKKAFGTVHIALGDSANEYGGLVECDVHLDGLVMAPTSSSTAWRSSSTDGTSTRCRRDATAGGGDRGPRGQRRRTPGPSLPGPRPGSSSGCGRSRAPVRGPAATIAPLVVESASGSILTDPDGNRYVDLAGSFAAATIGHAHPAVTAAVRDQVERPATSRPAR